MSVQASKTQHELVGISIKERVGTSDHLETPDTTIGSYTGTVGIYTNKRVAVTKSVTAQEAINGFNEAITQNPELMNLTIQSMVNPQLEIPRTHGAIAMEQSVEDVMTVTNNGTWIHYPYGKVRETMLQDERIQSARLTWNAIVRQRVLGDDHEAIAYARRTLALQQLAHLAWYNAGGKTFAPPPSQVAQVMEWQPEQPATLAVQDEYVQPRRRFSGILAAAIIAAPWLSRIMPLKTV